jgi:hypothetical protein
MVSSRSSSQIVRQATRNAQQHHSLLNNCGASEHFALNRDEIKPWSGAKEAWDHG